MDELCVICQLLLHDGQETVVLRAKGSASIRRASEERGDSSVDVHVGQEVHKECRRVYINPRHIALDKKRSATKLRDSRILRSTSQVFQYDIHCLFCGQPDTFTGKKKMHQLIPIRTTQFSENLAKICKSRNDEWAKIVESRITYVKDLHAADAAYHQSCSVNFRTGKQMPQLFVDSDPCSPSGKDVKHGRPGNPVQAEAFLKCMQFLQENDDEQMTIGDLVLKMKELLDGKGCDPYSARYMTERIKTHFGDEVVITQIKGKPNVVTFRTTAATILHKFYGKPKNKDAETEKLRIISTAANLLKNDIKTVATDKESYPTSEDMSSVDEASSLLPDSLKLMLNTLFVGENKDLKVASLGQAIMQATRPRVLLTPLQLGLGVQMHNHFASRFLIDTLNRLGFSTSYSEVHKYERSAAIVTQGVEVAEPTTQFVQYVADNVDHNIRTIDGLNTFHGMGMIAAYTPQSTATTSVPRVTVTANDIAAAGRVSIKFFKESGNVHPLKYESLPKFDHSDASENIDMLWKISLPITATRPGWSGMMQMIHKGDHPGPSSVQFLPMIDMNPSDMSCVLSTLEFVVEQAKKTNVTPIITFDQPLWWKALTIITSEPHLNSVVLKLGGFHTQMSFLGSIGYLMEGSGLQDILELVYAGNAVGHMLGGKAYARAVRGHLMVDAALNALLLSTAYDMELPITNVQREDEELQRDQAHHELNMPDDLKEASRLLDKLMKGEVSIGDANSDDILRKIKCKLETETSSLSSHRTACLWLQYMRMIDILRQAIKAERTGNWLLHLKSTSDMLPYLAATGHNLYAKSIHIYLQMMSRLPQNNPEVYQHFLDGLHVIRRSDRFWAGLSADLVIEQALMRSIKTSGGLTRGRGMTETQRLVWLLSMPSCAEVNNAMQSLTGVAHITSEQHKETGKSREKRDMDDNQKILAHLNTRNPFDKQNVALRSITTGVIGSPSVNCDEVLAVGNKILSSLPGQQVIAHSFRRKDQVVTLGGKAVATIGGESIQIDPQLLFQRLITAGTRCNDLPELLCYELCGYPPALFEARYVPRVANKPALADAIWTLLPGVQNPTGRVQYVLDGGALLQRVMWPKGATFESICTTYTNYVSRRYGQAIVVFDGYQDGPSTKDCTHQRRTGGRIGATVTFEADMTCTMKKEEFLSNTINKQRFIHLLSDRLQNNIACQTLHADGDADLLIVMTALASAQNTTTVLIGDDTDLLMLLIHHTTCDVHDVYLTAEPKANVRKATRCWNIKATQDALGPVICGTILFIHAILGCDTVSRIHGMGKGLALKKALDSPHFIQQANVFMNPKSTQAEVVLAGHNALVSLCNGKQGDTLNILRHRRFCEKVAISTVAVQPKVLPPTCAAAHYHSLRVFYQVHEWKPEEGVEFEPCDWGWRVVDSKMLPIMMDRDAAPKVLLEMIRCGCKSGCSSKMCSCRKHGLQCSTACGACKGTGCTNSGDMQEDSSDDEDRD